MLDLPFFWVTKEPRTQLASKCILLQTCTTFPESFVQFPSRAENVRFCFAGRTCFERRGWYRRIIIIGLVSEIAFSTVICCFDASEANGLFSIVLTISFVCMEL